MTFPGAYAPGFMLPSAPRTLFPCLHADSDEKIGEFWHSHDFTEFDTDAPDADFEVISTVPVQLELRMR